MNKNTPILILAVVAIAIAVAAFIRSHSHPRGGQLPIHYTFKCDEYLMPRISYASHKKPDPASKDPIKYELSIPVPPGISLKIADESLLTVTTANIGTEREYVYKFDNSSERLHRDIYTFESDSLKQGTIAIAIRQNTNDLIKYMWANFQCDIAHGETAPIVGLPCDIPIPPPPGT